MKLKEAGLIFGILKKFCNSVSLDRRPELNIQDYDDLEDWAP